MNQENQTDQDNRQPIKLSKKLIRLFPEISDEERTKQIAELEKKIEAFSTNFQTYAPIIIILQAQISDLKRKPLEEKQGAIETKKRFWNMLVSTVFEEMYTPPQNRPTTILDIGCGKCPEGAALTSFFGGQNLNPSTDNVNLIGIDTNKNDLKEAVKLHSINKLEGLIPYPNYTFIEGDATQLDNYPEIPETADVVVIRQQQISNDFKPFVLPEEKVWVEIFKQGLSRLNPEGIMIITSYTELEHNMALEALQKLDCEIVESKLNDHTRDGETIEDRIVAIIKKK